MRYEAYCLIDPSFYDIPTRVQDQGNDFHQARCPVPDAWERSGLDDWVVLTPHGVELPPQGWKIHVSATLDNAQDVLTAVWDYCVPRRIAFKFLRGADNLLLANAKYAHRGSSGKFITVYPADEASLEAVLTELGDILQGRPGPYVLSDLRWGTGPLYVRYGGFSSRTCVSPDGETVPAIEDGSGRLVPDVRGPAFRVPDWVTLPGFLEPQLAARNSATVTDLPYRIESALHFSNGGGLYTGHDLRTGQRVILKEARPYAGLTLDGADAVTRQRHEENTLERLRGLDCVPLLLDHFVLAEHHFLVEEFIEGQTLNSLFVDLYPLVLPQASDEVERAVAAVHDRGVIIGDLHSDNMLVSPDGHVVLIDFEGGRRTRPTEDGSGSPPPGSPPRPAVPGSTSTATRWPVYGSPCSCRSPACWSSTRERRSRSGVVDAIISSIRQSGSRTLSSPRVASSSPPRSRRRSPPRRGGTSGPARVPHHCPRLRRRLRCLLRETGERRTLPHEAGFPNEKDADQCRSPL
jgi:serine/threonine protein kinase